MARASKIAVASVYSVHPGVQMVQKWVREMRDKTGRSLEEWIALVRAEGPADEKGQRDWLKTHHGLGTNTAWWIAERGAGNKLGLADEDPDQYLREAPRYVDAMFAGKKGLLRPLYDVLLRLGLGIGPEAKACPCKTIVPLYRNHVFAEIKPATRTRIDMGFALGDIPCSGRLIDTGGLAKKNRITHRIPIVSEADIDEEVKRWMKAAYNRDA